MKNILSAIFFCYASMQLSYSSASKSSCETKLKQNLEIAQSKEFPKTVIDELEKSLDSCQASLEPSNGELPAEQKKLKKKAKDPEQPISTKNLFFLSTLGFIITVLLLP